MKSRETSRIKKQVPLTNPMKHQESRNPHKDPKRNINKPYCRSLEPSLSPPRFNHCHLFGLSFYSSWKVCSSWISFWVFVLVIFGFLFGFLVMSERRSVTKMHGWEIESARLNFNLNEIEFYKLNFYDTIMKSSSVNSI